MQKFFHNLVLLVVFVLILFAVYNKDVVFKAQTDQLTPKTQDIGSALPCPTTCPEKLQIENKEEVSYVIPSDEELAKLNLTESLKIFHRYTDYTDVLCRQQIRLGSVFAGGKHVCVDNSFNLKANNCLIYSFGSQNDFSFEEHAIRLYGCEVHTFDPFATGSNAPKGCTYHRIGIGAKDEIKNEKKFQTLGSFIKDLKHGKRVIDILKIDVEGAEWRVFEEVLEGNILQLQVKQIQIEMHFPYRRHEVSYSCYVLKLLRRLHEIGFLMFGRERNVFCRVCTVNIPGLDFQFTFDTEFCLLNKRFLTI